MAGQGDARTVEAVFVDGALADLRLLTPDGKVRHLVGRAGARLENELAEAALAGPGLPVFLGLGLGAGLARLLEERPGPVLVVDREDDLLAVSRSPELARDPNVVWIEDGQPETVMDRAVALLEKTGLPGFTVLAHPAWRRLDPAFYGELEERLTAHGRFKKAVSYRKFASEAPRVLVFDSDYFLIREILEALRRLEIPHLALPVKKTGRGEAGFVEAFLKAVTAFKPDCVLTVNHLGLDRDGALAGLLDKLGLPLASWFVDSPRLILHEYHNLAGPGTMVFTYDADDLDTLAAMGFTRAAHLPLATDPRRFAPPARPAAADHPWRAAVSFVGASMRRQVDEPLRRLAARGAATEGYEELGRAFIQSPLRLARDFLDQAAPRQWRSLTEAADRLDFEMLVTWEATRQYRLERVARLAPFSPLVVGDAGWETMLPGAGENWRRLPEIHYYRDLPRFYPLSAVNFNCTSMQMKGAVNQRVFDAPACGAFLLTDARRQLEALFEPGREVATYQEPGEIPELVAHYLAHPAERERLATAARERVLAEHTYEHRLTALLAAMRVAFG